MHCCRSRNCVTKQGFPGNKVEKNNESFSVFDSRNTFSLQQVLFRYTINRTNKATHGVDNQQDSCEHMKPCEQSNIILRLQQKLVRSEYSLQSDRHWEGLMKWKWHICNQSLINSFNNKAQVFDNTCHLKTGAPVFNPGFPSKPAYRSRFSEHLSPKWRTTY